MGTWFGYLHFPNSVSWDCVYVKPPLRQPYKPVGLPSDEGPAQGLSKWRTAEDQVHYLFLGKCNSLTLPRSPFPKKGTP